MSSLSSASFAGWKGHDTGRVLSEARRMAAEATANAAVGDPALSSAWTVRPGPWWGMASRGACGW